MRNVRSPSKSRTLRTLAVGAIVFLACPSKAHAAGYYNLGMFLTAQVGDFTWMSGASTSNATGTWGTIHIGSTSNVPPAEGDGGLWADMSGNIWIFGGYPNGDVNATNALWTFNTGNSQWTWMSGTSIQSGSTYGTKGSGATTNTPGSAYGVVSGTDLSGGLWMWGGYEQTKNSTTGGKLIPCGSTLPPTPSGPGSRARAPPPHPPTMGPREAPLRPTLPAPG